MRPCEISELIENCSPTFLSGIWDRKDWTEPPSSAQNPFSMIKNGSQALPQRGAAWNGNEKVCASFRRRWHRMVAYVGSFPAFFLRARTTTFFREKKLKKPRENCISLGLQLSLNLKFFGEWKIFAGRDLFIPRIFFVSTHEQQNCTYPMAPLESCFSSRSSVSWMLRCEYRLIGELNCLCTIRRCMVAIFVELFLDLSETTAVRLIICLLLQFDCTQIKQVVVGCGWGLVRDTGWFPTQDG